MIRAGNENGVSDHTSHGTVPAVVLGATLEEANGGVVVVVKQVSEGLPLVFAPGLVNFLTFCAFSVERGFACASNHFVVVSLDDGTDAGLELTSKEVIP